MDARFAWILRIASSHPPSSGPTGHTQRAQLTPTTAHNSLVPPHVSCQQPRAVARPLLSIRHLPGTLARCTEWFATRESSGPSPAARTALQPWRHFCFFVQWVCSRALCLCSGLASMLLRLQLPLLLWLQLPLLFVPHSIAGWPWYHSPVVRPWRLHPMPLSLPFLDGSSDVFCRRAAFCLLVLLTSAAGCSSSSTVFTAVGSSSSLGHRVSPVPLLPAPRSWAQAAAALLLLCYALPSEAGPATWHRTPKACCS